MYNFSKDYLKMVVKAAPELLAAHGDSEKFGQGEYFLTYTDKKRIDIQRGASMSLEEDFTVYRGVMIWVPRLDQLVHMASPIDKLQGGARRSLVGIDNPYFIPNSSKTYQSFEEQALAVWMNRQHRKIWVEGGTKGSDNWNWVLEKDLLEKKIGVSTGTNTDSEGDIRTIELKDNNDKVIGCRTEKIVYNFEKGEVEVLEVLNEYKFVVPSKKK